MQTNLHSSSSSISKSFRNDVAPWPPGYGWVRRSGVSTTQTAVRNASSPVSPPACVIDGAVLSSVHDRLRHCHTFHDCRDGHPRHGCGDPESAGVVTGIARGIPGCVRREGICAPPFRIYSTFVIEERFGFNRTTVKTFVFDLPKGALHGVVVALLVLALMLWLFAVVGQAVWIYAWMAMTAFSPLLIRAFMRPVPNPVRERIPPFFIAAVSRPKNARDVLFATPIPWVEAGNTVAAPGRCARE